MTKVLAASVANLILWAALILWTTMAASAIAVHGYNIVRNEKGKLVFIKHIEFPSEVK